MSTAELKIDLINQITNITEKSRLEEIRQLLRFQSDNSVFETTEEEKDAIHEARNQIANGNFFTHEEVQNEIREWLKK
ncbi:hypothetical protein FW774_05690 [Pedobacter sp. BS3]|uniref:hypothetical protein n=1 Tax=Pedobacter sp. BS3 TaxID=2567937 RepID=UPI0011ECC62D|nr:hypothetical protein [Pedobacter sp. BS3]TZF84483.1 hypothetical protein FW774_05690 [Pedobacter sp. BS3]